MKAEPARCPCRRARCACSAVECGVMMGDRVRIGANCVLRDMTVGADTEVFPSCVLEKSFFGEGWNVGLIARMDLGGVLFFFQAEDGIRDHCVTGVQTCALPI